MALSSNRQGHRPFTAAMPGSNPAGVTNMASSSNRSGQQPLKLQMWVRVPQGSPYGGVPERS